MTIIQPHKSPKPFINFIMCAMLVAIIAFGACAIALYNQTVNLEHGLQAERRTLENLHAANTELKNKFYQAIDMQNLQTIIKERGFIKITAPHYLSLL